MLRRPAKEAIPPDPNQDMVGKCPGCGKLVEKKRRELVVDKTAFTNSLTGPCSCGVRVYFTVKQAGMVPPTEGEAYG